MVDNAAGATIHSPDRARREAHRDRG
jgi:hypothetical protein